MDSKNFPVENQTPPVENQTPAAENQTPVKRMAYFFKVAPIKTRIMAFIAMGLGLVMVLTVLLGANSAVNDDFIDIPIIDLTITDDEADEFKDNVDEILDRIEYAEDMDDEFTLDSIEDEYDMSIKKLKDALDPVSLNSIILIAEADNEDEAAAMFTILVALIWIHAIIVMLLMVFGALFLKKGLIIAGYAVSVIFFPIWVGFGALAVATIAFVGYLVLLSIANGDYKGYKESLAK